MKKWLLDSDLKVKSIDVLSLGPHARRSWVLFKKAFGNDIDIGVISVVNMSYDPKRWWKYSSGVRSIINEAIAYVYVCLFFYPVEY